MAWCWAVNGFFSVLGATLTTVLSMALGFDRTILVGLALYVVAAFGAAVRERSRPMSWRSPRRPPTTGPPSRSDRCAGLTSVAGCGAGR